MIAFLSLTAPFKFYMMSEPNFYLLSNLSISFLFFPHSDIRKISKIPKFKSNIHVQHQRLLFTSHHFATKHANAFYFLPEHTKKGRNKFLFFYSYYSYSCSSCSIFMTCDCGNDDKNISIEY